MDKRKYKAGKEKRDGTTFVAFPTVVLNSVAYLGLSAHARMLLVDIAAQYSGDNNGDFSIAWVLMKPRGWKSEDTLSKAKKELLESGLVVETRKGARPNKASLYALTWLALDQHPKLDMTQKTFPRGKWREKEPPSPIKITILTTPGVVAAPL
ncbi:hypothetical protein LJR029_005473 [Caballeronia sp. LjRoot29]|uniref:hypothetical protein n=1 Tax=Caballeronia sp. LjRoot29 TaxID=3342315 RepID=UPI003ED1582B